ncbi:MAG: RHS repeat-associated core domain-containing protein [Planctomycetota bacterium]
MTKQLTHNSTTAPVFAFQISNPALQRTYTYDANKNLTDEGNSMPGKYSFITFHDAEDRLTAFERENQEFQTWTLSDVGDWDAYSGEEIVGGLLTQFSETRAHNDVHEINSITSGGTTTTLQHDAKGNLTTDEDGNTYLWDFDNRLKEVRNSSGDLLASHTYDALGRRVTKTKPGSLPGDPDVTTAYVCLTDDSGMGQMLTEYEDNTLKRLYTYGTYIDEPITLTRFDASLPGGEETLYYHLDRQYNVIALTDTTSGGGVAVERYVYTPYGDRRILAPDSVTVRQTSAVGNPLGHQGLYHDEETDLVYNRARYRDSELGRWINRDAQEYVDSFSLYTYVMNNPLIRLDPTGNQYIPGGVNPGGQFPGSGMSNQNILDFYENMDNAAHNRNCQKGAPRECPYWEAPPTGPGSKQEWLDRACAGKGPRVDEGGPTTCPDGKKRAIDYFEVAEYLCGGTPAIAAGVPFSIDENRRPTPEPGSAANARTIGGEWRFVFAYTQYKCICDECEPLKTEFVEADLNSAPFSRFRNYESRYIYDCRK